MAEFTNGIFNTIKNLYLSNRGSILRTIIYTIGHFVIAITCLMLISDVSFIIAMIFSFLYFEPHNNINLKYTPPKIIDGKIKDGNFK